MRILKEDCRVIFAIVWICMHPAGAYDVHGNSNVHDADATDTRHFMREIRDSDFESRLIPIKSPRVASKNFATAPLPVEPDAEILPAHYTGVKPPGVDHMELKRVESRALKTRPEVRSTEKSGRSDARLSAKQQSTNVEREEGRERVASIENSRTGDAQGQKRRTEYVEAAGKKKTKSDRANNSKHQHEEARGEAGGRHRTKSGGNKRGKALGYHNVYHKDEYKKDHDFFDDDHHGGLLKKHGRYDEKHVAIEGRFEKGNSNGSGFEQAEQKKQGISENSQAGRETKGHDARRGYDGFFKNFQGFAKQGARGEGKKFGFAEAKAR